MINRQILRNERKILMGNDPEQAGRSGYLINGIDIWDRYGQIQSGSIHFFPGQPHKENVTKMHCCPRS